MNRSPNLLRVTATPVQAPMPALLRPFVRLLTCFPTSLILICLLFGAIACGKKQLPASLTIGQATDLALKLANNESEALYQCRPFTNGPPAQLRDGCWKWQTRQAKGQGDIEANVNFDTNGANPTVRVLLLDNRAAPAFRIR